MKSPICKDKKSTIQVRHAWIQISLIFCIFTSFYLKSHKIHRTQTDSSVAMVTSFQIFAQFFIFCELKSTNFQHFASWMPQNLHVLDFIPYMNCLASYHLFVCNKWKCWPISDFLVRWAWHLSELQKCQNSKMPDFLSFSHFHKKLKDVYLVDKTCILYIINYTLFENLVGLSPSIFLATYQT